MQRQKTSGEKERNNKVGSYTLLIRLDSDCRIQVGKLGNFVFKGGYYIYTGSAINNIEARIERHKRKDKKIRWHIDYLLNEKASHIIAYRKYYSRKECDINKNIKEIDGTKILIKGFGSSDCKNGCESHLVYYDNFDKYHLKYISKLFNNPRELLKDNILMRFK